METQEYPICADCGNAFKPGDPFCIDCGRLSPSMLNTGDFSVEVQDVPAQRSRERVIRILRAWFPTVDAIRADELLRSARHILVRGVDETSARRFQAALQALRVDSRLVREGVDRSWQERLLNPALAMSAACMILSLALGATAAVFLLPVGVAAPFAWAFLVSRKKPALLRVEEPSPRYEKWSRLAQEYAQAIKELGSPDREVVICLARTVFDLQLRLGSNSLAAVAAGEDRGDLYARLTDAIHTALSLGRRISALEDEDEGEALHKLRQELVALAGTVSETADWFQNLERRPSKEPRALDNELRDVTERIDRILGEVHSRSETSQLPRKPLSA
jgi:hypothetical protein